MKEIKLTQGKVALVDDEDFILVSQFKWCARKSRYTFYAVTGVRTTDGKKAILRMHTLLLPDAKIVDHADGSGLNNRRNNLRPATRTQNNANSRKRSGVTSQFRGVCWDKSKGKFKAQIAAQCKHKYLGCFTSEVEAAKAYDAAAVQLFGEFARLNFPHQQLQTAA